MNSVELHISKELQEALNARLEQFTRNNTIERMWSKDPFVWKQDTAYHKELADRLGWLYLPETMKAKADDLMSFAAEVKNSYKHFLLMGMGGSSLCPEVLQKVLGNKPGYPSLVLMDSTHPGCVEEVDSNYDIASLLGIIASKSGGTAETTSFFNHFYSRSGNNGKQFAAITDPGTVLEKIAAEKGFLKVFSSPPEVGGRYSALCEFGMVPAALLGADLHKLLASASEMSDACKKVAPENPGAVLGALMGEAALRGIDKITFVTSPSLTPFPQWIEQLIAESTGKEGKGILPVADEVLSAVHSNTPDRLFVVIVKEGEEPHYKNELEALQQSGAQLVRITLTGEYALAQEFFRWEFATAAAGVVLDINPFDQPDVQLAKTLANESMAQYKETKSFAAEHYSVNESNCSLLGDTEGATIKEALTNFLAKTQKGEYIAVMAFLPYDEATSVALRTLATTLRDAYSLPVTVGYGPRFLHSTGQLHKGGANNGYFIQIIDDKDSGPEIPGLSYSFGALVTAQGRGDFNALKNKNRRSIKIRLSGNPAEGISKLF